jgi:hypothetical protein
MTLDGASKEQCKHQSGNRVKHAPCKTSLSHTRRHHPIKPCSQARKPCGDWLDPLLHVHNGTRVDHTTLRRGSGLKNTGVSPSKIAPAKKLEKKENVCYLVYSILVTAPYFFISLFFYLKLVLPMLFSTYAIVIVL